MKPSSPAVSARMRRQASKDTAAELTVRRLLHAAGLRYRVEYPVPGMARRRIDVAFTSVKVAVLIDGCFWHGCPEHATQPKSNAEWWRQKLNRNMARDVETTEHLAASGWEVLRFWEHEAPEDVAVRIAAAVERRGRGSDRRAGRLSSDVHSETGEVSSTLPSPRPGSPIRARPSGKFEGARWHDLRMTSGSGEMAMTPGTVATREEIIKVFGGSTQGGICPSIEKRSVNLFSDPSAGEKLGYYDGWLAEDDDLGPVFEYTGAGKSGNQTFQGVSGSGNRAILRHAEQDRTLRVFKQVGKAPESDAKTHEYLGEFILDQLQPYVWRQVPGEDGIDRDVIIFRLRPESGSTVERSAKDIIPVADKTVAELVNFTLVTAAMLQTDPATSGALSTPKQRRKNLNAQRRKLTNAATGGTFVVPEAFNTRMSLRSASASFVAVRREAELTQAYREHLESLGHKVGAFQIRIKGLSSTLRTDLYDATDHTLYEVKGASAREDVRMALGQLLDYSRYVSTEANPGTPGRAILLPTRPDADMFDLCKMYAVDIIYRAEDGAFSLDTTSRLTPTATPGPQG